MDKTGIISNHKGKSLLKFEGSLFTNYRHPFQGLCQRTMRCPAALEFLTERKRRREVTMDFFDILTMVGGLALFLYGMQVLGDGLSKASGGRMERILERLTSSKIRAVFLGAAVTAVIQSSSAATVMVVGFVNSGIMKLSQAIGVIMGANIGTTVTSWILSLSGIESGNFWIRLLKPSSFAPVLAIIGVGILLFSTRGKRKNLAQIFVGVAVLMFGMATLSDAV